MREEMAEFIKHRGSEVAASTIYIECGYYKKYAAFTETGKKVKSFRDRETEMWMRQFKAGCWRKTFPDLWGVWIWNVKIVHSYIVIIWKGTGVYRKAADNRTEQEKDIWEMKAGYPINENLIKNVKTINFTGIPQEGILEELKKGIYLNLQNEAIACVQKRNDGDEEADEIPGRKEREVLSCGDITRGAGKSISFT